MKGGTHGRTNGRTDERKSPCVLQDFVPFGAAAQKPLVIQECCGGTDGGTDGRIDGPTETVRCSRVSSTKNVRNGKVVCPVMVMVNVRTGLLLREDLTYIFIYPDYFFA